MSTQEPSIEIRRWTAPQLDPAWIVLSAILVTLAVVAPHQATTSIAFTAKAVWGVLPFFALSIALSAYAKASGAENLIAKAFTGRIGLMILFASLMGALSPFCSCGVIPVIAALLTSGVPLAPVMAFWLSSPLMDPSMFVLTAGVLGFQFAVAKTLAAIGVGLLGGYGILALQRVGLLAGPPLRDGVGNGGCAGSKIRNPKAVEWRFWNEPARREAFANTARNNTLFLGKWLLLAFTLESLMVAYVPRDFIGSVAGEGGFLSIAAATLVGIPSYMNGNAALPLVAGLVEKGMAPGAAMAFLIGGGVTSIPAALAVWAITPRKLFAAYLAFATLGALAAGVVFQAAVG
ncbi:permease [Bradyrhizobium sp. WSM 1738]|uniref:permease n=1 Tax=Bradyrhizobium hereditatis TaxID=2821405 RepID=UPI001CE26100|nr:permease [Bradyrhizobium hereditatis]MCA6115949.1 permease [Bradyrhizobium hereditatis]